MTLRSPFQRQQLLFVFAALSALSLGASQVRAQAPAPAAPGQDVVVDTNNRQAVGKVLGVSNGGLQIQVQVGTITLPLKSVKSVTMAPPPEVALVQQLMEGKRYGDALIALQRLEKYKGLPTEWAQQATAMLGDVYIALNDLPKAEAAYKAFQELYSGAQSGPQTEIGLARLAMAKKDIETAKSKVEPVTEAALKEKVVPIALAPAYSQAFFLRGQIAEEQQDFAGALENYLRTVTLFYHDRTAAAQAQERADALRKAHPEVFIP